MFPIIIIVLIILILFASLFTVKQQTAAIIRALWEISTSFDNLAYT